MGEEPGEGRLVWTLSAVLGKKGEGVNQGSGGGAGEGRSDACTGKTGPADQLSDHPAVGRERKEGD